MPVNDSSADSSVNEPVQVHRLIAARANTDSLTLRSAMVEGREHLIVPVVALIGDKVVRPIHSLGPELVPASELAIVPAQWNGRPIVPDHPDNGLASANNPHTLTEMRYGWIFDGQFTNNELQFNAYIDVERAKSLGGEPQRVVEALSRHEPVEVSVGAWTSLVPMSGVTSDGTKYEYRWRGLISDHLAMGMNGSRGACSVEMGCGARAIRSNSNSNSEPEETLMGSSESNEPVPTPTPEPTPTPTPTPEPKPEPEPTPAVLRAACSCGGNSPNNPSVTEETKGASMPDQPAAVSDAVKALVGRLIACEASPFTDADTAKLQSWPESTLNDLASTYASLAVKPETTSAETEEAWLAKAPASLRAMHARYQAMEAQERAALVKGISGATNVFSVEELNAKPTDELNKLAVALRANSAVDHSLARLASITPAGSIVGGVASATEYPKPIDPYRVEERRALREASGRPAYLSDVAAAATAKAAS